MTGGIKLGGSESTGDDRAGKRRRSGPARISSSLEDGGSIGNVTARTSLAEPVQAEDLQDFKLPASTDALS